MSDDDWFKEISVSAIPVTFRLDSGVQDHVLHVSTYWNVQPVVALQPAKVLLSGFVSDMKVKLMGIATLPIISLISSAVMQEIFSPLRKTNCHIGQRSVMCCIVNQSGMHEECPENFKGLGELGRPYDIQVDETVTPPIQSVYRVPISKHAKPKLRNALIKLETAGVIGDAAGLSEWVDNLVIVIRKTELWEYVWIPNH